MERDGLTREEILNRANRQIDEDIKMRLCDFVIVNNVQELVIPQVLELHDQLLKMSEVRGQKSEVWSQKSEVWTWIGRDL